MLQQEHAVAGEQVTYAFWFSCFFCFLHWVFLVVAGVDESSDHPTSWSYSVIMTWFSVLELNLRNLNQAHVNGKRTRRKDKQIKQIADPKNVANLEPNIIELKDHQWDSCEFWWFLDILVISVCASSIIGGLGCNVEHRGIFTNISRIHSQPQSISPAGAPFISSAFPDSLTLVSGTRTAEVEPKEPIVWLFHRTRSKVPRFQGAQFLSTSLGETWRNWTSESFIVFIH